MAIKDAAEMFGDGSAGNPQVPIDLNAPPGFNALSRGVAFGEQVTSAIKNRTPYSLILNDEDLNTRLALFEVGGLDTAYDLGATATPGGGRVITKDGGAVETISTLATSYDDDRANAHIRANMLSDTLAAGVGFDVEATDNTGAAWAGLLDRRRIADISTTNTSVTDGNAIQVNPGGVDADAVRVTTGGQSFHNSGVTELLLGYDLIELVGTASDDGLYIIAGLVGGTDTDVSVTDLSGTPASFTANDTGVLHLYRPIFRSNHDGSKFVGMPAAGETLVLNPGLLDENVDTEGATQALQTLYRQADGTSKAATSIDYKGLVEFDLDAADILPTSGAYSDQTKFGHFTNRRLTPPSNEVEATHSVLGVYNAVPDARFDFTSLQPISEGPTTLTFVAATATDGEVQGTTTTIERKVAHGGGLVHIGGFGWYWVVRGNRARTLRVDVRELDGSLPSSLPTTGTAPANFYTFQSLGKLPQIDPVYDDAPILRSGFAAVTTVTPHALISGGGEEVDACALMLTGMNTNFNQCFIRAFTQSDLGTFLGRPKEVFRVNQGGEVCSRSGMYSPHFTSNDDSGEFNYKDPTARVRTVHIPISSGMPYDDGAGADEWLPIGGAPTGIGGGWESQENLGLLQFNLSSSGYVPMGATITAIRLLCKPGAARATTVRLQFIIDRLDTTWTGTEAVAVTNVVAFQEDDGTTDVQTISWTGSMTLTPHTAAAGKEWIMLVAAGNTGAASPDEVYGVRIEFEDPGPRNF
jgi:hypothetical protein